MLTCAHGGSKHDILRDNLKREILIDPLNYITISEPPRLYVVENLHFLACRYSEMGPIALSLELNLLGCSRNRLLWCAFLILNYRLSGARGASRWSPMVDPRWLSADSRCACSNVGRAISSSSGWVVYAWGDPMLNTYNGNPNFTPQMSSTTHVGSVYQSPCPSSGPGFYHSGAGMANSMAPLDHWARAWSPGSTLDETLNWDRPTHVCNYD
jgi:hypothetical protein